MYCEHCGREILNGEKYCYNCGDPAPQPISTPPKANQRVYQKQSQQPVYPEPIVIDSPKPTPTYIGLANASFYVSLAALILCWVPILDICLTIAAIVITIIALTKVKYMKKFSWMPMTALVYILISLGVNIFTLL